MRKTWSALAVSQMGLCERGNLGRLEAIAAAGGKSEYTLEEILRLPCSTAELLYAILNTDMIPRDALYNIAAEVAAYHVPNLLGAFPQHAQLWEDAITAIRYTPEEDKRETLDRVRQATKLAGRSPQVTYEQTKEIRVLVAALCTDPAEAARMAVRQSSVMGKDRDCEFARLSALVNKLTLHI